MSPLEFEVKPGDPDYQMLYDLWIKDGKGRQLDVRFAEKMYWAEFPNGGTLPTFLLMVSLPGVTSPDLTSPLSGSQMALDSWQRTWHGNRLLPKQ